MFICESKPAAAGCWLAEWFATKPSLCTDDKHGFFYGAEEESGPPTIGSNKAQGKPVLLVSFQ